MEKILIVKTSALGDIVHTFPVLDYLRTKFPEAQIDWVIEKPFAELVEAHPQINQVFTVNIKAWRKNFLRLSTYIEIRKFHRQLRSQVYDAAFDLQGNVKSGLILAQVRSKHKVGFGRETVPEWPNMLFTNKRFNTAKGANIRDDYLAIVQAFFRDNTNHQSGGTTLKVSEGQRAIVHSILQNPLFQQAPKVIVCPGSAWRNKQITPESLSAFLAHVQKYLKCNFLLVWGSPEERNYAIQLHQQCIGHSVVVDRLSLPMLQNLIAASDLVVAMDSLPLHLAGTTSTPTFSVFGPSLAHKYKPQGAQHLAYQGTCPYGRTFEKRCPILRTCPTGACIRDVSGNTLFENFRHWWEKQGL